MKTTLKKITLTIIMALTLISVTAQDLTQTIRGKVSDEDSEVSTIGTHVIVIGSDPFLGASTNLQGEFKIENVPVGRVDLRISSMGYEEKIISNVLVTSGKEIVLDIKISESVAQLAAVTVSAKKNKAENLNEMAVLSAKAFTVEETKRYAGAINDPARMASAFAGASEHPSGSNEIVVRGNSPRGISWRLEGIEIPNPNHFAEEGSSGGPINALNSAMLDNSDFYSGAFAPEYGNAYSGVFDMKLRNGNNEKREYSFSVGVLGTDFTAEGPIKKGKPASFLVNYRYSTLSLLDKANIVDFQGVPRYQDASFKLMIPTKKAGIFTVFGLGGMSNILQEDKDEGNEEIIYSINDFGANLGVVGLRHMYLFNDKTYIKNTISFSTTLSEGNMEKMDDYGDYFTFYDASYSKTATKFSSTISNKINSKNRLQSGIVYTHKSFNTVSKYHDYDLDTLFTGLDAKGNTGLLQAFTSWKYRINEDLTFVGGLHYTHLLFNNNNSIEPRASIKWQLKPNQSITAGFGIHSKVETTSIYMANVLNENNEEIQPNKNLEFAKARHYVLGYNNMITQNLNFKVELYYQDLYNVPVKNDINDAFSILNLMGHYVNDPMVNEGTGANYGAELTLERFFVNDYYFLVTGSLFESKYKALDGVNRNTIYNSNYVGNILAGKEFKIGNPDKNRTLSLNARISLIGGTYYTPIDLEKSITEGHQVDQEDQLYANRGDDIFKADLSVSLRRNRPKSSHEVKLEVRNVTNNQGLVTQFYNGRKQEIENYYQQPLFPVVSYTINF